MSRFVAALGPKAWSVPGPGNVTVRDFSSSIGSASRSLASTLGGSKPSSPAPAPTASATSNIESSINIADAGPAHCGHCDSEKCCNSLWPFKDLAQETRPEGVLGPFTWCGLTVFVAVAGAQHESPATTEYRREVLSERLQELTLPLDIVPEVLAPEPTPRVKSPVKRIAKPQKEYTLSELRTHKQKDDAWIAVEGRVIDVTQWQDQHPGGADILMGVAGEDATAEFKKLHEPGVIDAYIPGAVKGVLVDSTPPGDTSYEILDSASEGDGQCVGEPDQEPTGCIHSTGPGVIQCECSGTEIIPRAKATPPQVRPTSPIDVSQPANPAVAAEVTALLSQLESLIGSQGSGFTLSDLLPKLAINYTCEDADDDEEEGIQMELVVKFKAKKGADGQHPMCVQARAALGAEGRCGGR